MSSDPYLARTRVVLICIAIFVTGIAFSMAAYPGGTWWAPKQQGHDFWSNFLCDLLHDPALNLKANRLGALLAKLSMLAFVVGLGVFWSMSDRWLNSSRMARRVSSLGVLGTLPLAMVPLTPSNRYPALHTAAVLLGGLPALIAFLSFSVTLVRQARTPLPIRLLTACLSLLIVICLCLYAGGALGISQSPLILPALERGAVILLLGWLLTMLHGRPHCW